MGKRWYYKLALRLTIVTLIASLISSSLLTALAQEADNPTVPVAETATEKIEPVSENAAPVEQKKEPEPPRQEKEVVSEYSQLMRTVDTLQNNEVEKAEKKDEVIEKIDTLIDVEKGRLERLGVSEEKQEKYFRILQKQKEQLQNPTPAVDEPPVPVEEPGFFERLFGDEEPVVPAADEVQIPQEPATFEFAKDDIQIQQLEDTHIQPQAFQYVPQLLASLVVVDEAHAFADNYMPTIDLVRGDDQEVIITPEMRNLVKSLNNNPVAILNYLRTNIRYEPYYGAKKGSVGCFAERVCNDVDGSSLAIALYRAAGVPARYEKSAAVFSVEDLKALLGVDETKTVFAALALNKVPVFTITDGLVGENLDDADFSNETHLALEWTHFEIFYDYDQRGGNTDNSLSFDQAQDNAAVREILNPYPKKQWLPLDAIVQSYTRAQRPILVDQTHFDSEAFWYGFYQYQGNLNPLQKYTQDLQGASGQQLSANLTEKTLVPEQVSILPVTLPYYIGAGDAGQIQIGREKFAAPPEWMKQKIVIQLKKGSNNEVLVSTTLWGSQANNAKIDLGYEGATEVDKNVINDNGGIHQTPSALVDIVPYLRTDYGKFFGVNNDPNVRPVLAIGDTLVLHFEYMIGDRVIYSDEKFSVGGNDEGIFITLSQVAADSVFDDENDPERANKVLLDGNATLAREYIRQINADAQVLKKSLDYDFNIHFGRAVVTQNRILREVDGVPTTFEFKGFSLDASTYITDYSNRGNYKNHRKDFRLIWGQHASYMEAALFETIAGLESLSTVKGLQYAYANPNDYSMHRINLQNENVIDGLALSNNTKQNLHTEVQAGNTVLTPNKPIQHGNWRGILYVSLDDDWTGQYAIGEQVANNGADTINDMEILAYEDDTGVQRQYYQVAFAGGGKFLYEQNRVNTVACKQSDWLSLLMDANWMRTYGQVCMSSTLTFGQNTHAYIQGTRGAYFRGQKNGAVTYELSKKIETIDSLMESYLTRNYPNSFTTGYSNLRFSQILGTYVQNLCIEQPGPGINHCDDDDEGALYFTPFPQGNYREEVALVSGDMLDKLDDDDKAVVKRLGFPRTEQRQAAPSPQQETGTYQDFLNGQLYQYTTELPLIAPQYYPTWTYYTYGKLYDLYEAGGGTRSALGFPDADPIIRNGFTFQRFQSDDEIEWNNSNGATRIVRLKKYRCELYGNETNPLKLNMIFVHGVFDSGLEALDNLYGFAVTFIKGATHLSETMKSLGELADAISKINRSQIWAAATQLGNGLAEEYNTSLGPNGCAARVYYIEGRIMGEALLILAVATKTVKLVDKIKAFAAAKNLKYVRLVVEWIEYVQGLEARLARLVIPNRFSLERIKHVIIGKFDDAYNYIGTNSGLHSYSSVKKAFEKNIIKISTDESGQAIYSNLRDLPKDLNGVRKGYIVGKNGRGNYKTFFPEEWTDDDIVSAIAEAANSPIPGGNQFRSIVSRRGKSVPVRGYFDGNQITTGFPDFTD